MQANAKKNKTTYCNISLDTHDIANKNYAQNISVHAHTQSPNRQFKVFRINFCFAQDTQFLHKYTNTPATLFFFRFVFGVVWLLLKKKQSYTKYRDLFSSSSFFLFLLYHQKCNFVNSIHFLILGMHWFCDEMVFPLLIDITHEYTTDFIWTAHKINQSAKYQLNFILQSLIFRDNHDDDDDDDDEWQINKQISTTIHSALNTYNH